MREYTATVKLDRQKRITIPKAIRDKENLQPGDVLEVVIRIKEETNPRIGEQGNAEVSCST
ncbi:MAG: AbrB/MazE/SpoVT family DNA-binding domain-containing protein [Methanotrichaceae archaeon]